jgi:hypothetical protein
VTTRLFRAAPVTLSLVLGGIVVWLLIAIPLGVYSALRPRSLLDRAATVFVLIGVSAHPGLARPDARLRLRSHAARLPGRRLLQPEQPLDRLRRALPMDVFTYSCRGSRSGF